MVGGGGRQARVLGTHFSKVTFVCSNSKRKGTSLDLDNEIQSGFQRKLTSRADSTDTRKACISNYR